jgi:hypothetical protein
MLPPRFLRWRGLRSYSTGLATLLFDPPDTRLGNPPSHRNNLLAFFCVARRKHLGPHFHVGRSRRRHLLNMAPNVPISPEGARWTGGRGAGNLGSSKSRSQIRAAGLNARNLAVPGYGFSDRFL